MEVIGSNLDTLNSATKKCHRAGGTPSVRTRYMVAFKDKVIFTCYGEETEEVPGGTVKDLPPRVVTKLRRAEDKTDTLLEMAGIEKEKKETEEEAEEENGVLYETWGEWKE